MTTADTELKVGRESKRWEMKKTIRNNSFNKFASEGERERENNSWRGFGYDGFLKYT